MTRRIDAHVHLWETVNGFWDGEPTSNVGSRNGRIRKGAEEFQMMPHAFDDSRSSAERLIVYLDAHGIDLAVALQEWMDGAQDDYLAEAKRRYPERLRVMSLLPVHVADDPGAYVQALARGGLDGVLYSHRTLDARPDFRLDDARLEPVWTWLALRGQPAVFKLPPGARQTAELEAVALRHPELTLVASHLGLPRHAGWMDQVRLARYPNVFLDCGGLTAFYKAEGFPFPTARAALRFAIQEVGAHKIMWGSDYPRTLVDFSYKQNIDWIAEGGYFSAEEQVWLLGRTAARVYLREDAI